MAGEASILVKATPVALLELKFQEWLKVQPEWLLIVNMSRQQRRAAMKELANKLYTIPIMDGVNTVPRVIRRKAAKALSHATRTGQITEMVAEALVEAVRLDAENSELEAGREEAVEGTGATETYAGGAPHDAGPFEGSEPVVGFLETDEVTAEEPPLD